MAATLLPATICPESVAATLLPATATSDPATATTQEVAVPLLTAIICPESVVTALLTATATPDPATATTQEVAVPLLPATVRPESAVTPLLPATVHGQGHPVPPDLATAQPPGPTAHRPGGMRLLVWRKAVAEKHLRDIAGILKISRGAGGCKSRASERLKHVARGQSDEGAATPGERTHFCFQAPEGRQQTHALPNLLPPPPGAWKYFFSLTRGRRFALAPGYML